MASLETLAQMEIRPLDSRSAEEIAGLMADPRLNRWLDFGNGRRSFTANGLQVMARSPAFYVRAVYEPGGRFLGAFGFVGVDNPHRTASVWGLRAFLRPPAKSTAEAQLRTAVHEGFTTLGLEVVQAWAVAGNGASMRTLRNAGFSETGRLRDAHLLDGERRDRILFDITAREYFAERGADAPGGVEERSRVPARAARPARQTPEQRP